MDQEITQVVTAAATTLVSDLADASRQHDRTSDADLLVASVAHALDRAMQRLGQTGLWGPINRVPSNVFWQIAEPWLRYGDLQVHARTKPRGYAGDFQLLQKICLQQCCDHPLGAAMDRYFQQQAAPRAVRERTLLVSERLCGRLASARPGRLKVVSVGSGAAMELQQLVARLAVEQRSRLDLQLLDIDQQALDFACGQLLRQLAPDQVQTHRTNLSRLAGDTATAGAAASADYVFCPGFFDYLDTGAAADMLRLLLNWLAPGGELTVFNFSPANTSRAYMEWIGCWYLTYRDGAAMRSLGDQVADWGSVSVGTMADEALVELTIRRAG